MIYLVGARMAYREIRAPRGQPADDHVIMELPGEVDLLNAADVSDMLLAALHRGAAGVIADMSRTRFCDVAGCRAVTRASRRAQLLGTWARAVVPSPAVRRVFRLTGADQLIPVCTTLDDALALVTRTGSPATAPALYAETPERAERADWALRLTCSGGFKAVGSDPGTGTSSGALGPRLREESP